MINFPDNKYNVRRSLSNSHHRGIELTTNAERQEEEEQNMMESQISSNKVNKIVVEKNASGIFRHSVYDLHSN